MAFEDFERGTMEFAPARVPEGTYTISRAVYQIGQGDEYAWCNAQITMTDPDDGSEIGNVGLRCGYMADKDGKTLNFIPSPDGKNPCGIEGYNSKDHFLRILKGTKGTLELKPEDLEHYSGHYIIARKGFRFMPGELEQFISAFKRLTGVEMPDSNLAPMEGYTFKCAFEPVAGSAKPKKGEKEAQTEKEVLVPVQLVGEPGSKKATVNSTKTKAKAAEEDEDDETEAESEPEPKKKTTTTTKGKKSGPTDEDIARIEGIILEFLRETPGKPMPQSKWLQYVMDSVESEPAFLPTVMNVTAHVEGRTDWHLQDDRPWLVDEESGRIYVKAKKTA